MFQSNIWDLKTLKCVSFSKDWFDTCYRVVCQWWIIGTWFRTQMVSNKPVRAFWIFSCPYLRFSSFFKLQTSFRLTASRFKHDCPNWQRIFGSFFLSLSSRQLFKVKTSLFAWKHCHISLKWWSFHSITLFEQKKVSKRCHMMTFSWLLESKRTGARGKRSHKFHAIAEFCVKTRSNKSYPVWIS